RGRAWRPPRRGAGGAAPCAEYMTPGCRLGPTSWRPPPGRRIAMSLPNRSLAAMGSPLVRHDFGESQGVDWLTMHHGAGPGYHPCFSERLLHEIKRVQETIRNR